MAKILGANRVRQKLRSLQNKAREANASVIVGYTAEYAVYVHENMEARHAPGKQAKYLEQPFREKRGEIASIVRRTTRATGSLLDGLLMGGQFLQHESQKIVPVSGWHSTISPPRQGSGNLKGSAFTRKE
jgi:hypothetical protein